MFLAQLSWNAAEKLFSAGRPVLIPLGAAAKEHGPHLPLGNDFLLAEYLAAAVAARAEVLIAPTLNYGYYPAFVEYPGSVSLRLETARDLILDICRGYAGFGARSFYVLNTGISTLHALRPAAKTLAAEGLLLRYTDLSRILAPVEARLSEQAGGSHADEIETSIMLFIAPRSVRMRAAVSEYRPGKGPLTRDPRNRAGVYSASGVWGDPTLATRRKGKLLVEALVRGIVEDLRDLNAAA
ncbi:MAG: creatininase family protein [Burkholderiales bacterium]